MDDLDKDIDFADTNEGFGVLNWRRFPINFL